MSAAESFDKARALLQPLTAIDPTLESQLGAILTRQAAALAEQKKTIESLALLQKAVDKLSQLVAAAPKDDEARERLSESLWELARLSRAAGETEKAKNTDQQREDLWKTQAPAKLAKLALSLTRRGLLIGYGKTPISERARSVRELDLDQAAANLSLAIQLGFKDLALLRKERDSWALLERADLQSLIKELESPPPAGASQSQKK